MPNILKRILHLKQTEKSERKTTENYYPRQLVADWVGRVTRVTRVAARLASLLISAEHKQNISISFTYGLDKAE